MRRFIPALFLLFSCSLYAQGPLVESKVYQWKDLQVEKEATRERRPILKGSTTDLSSLEIHASTLQPGKTPHSSHSHSDEEELIIIREGKLKITINNKSSVVGAGSIALIMPGDEHGLENDGDTPAIYYILRYKSKLPININRGKEAGGSFVLDFNEIPFTAHDKGGIRKYFDKPTAMCSRFEMHVTTLNTGLKSHDPHTHRAEEIVVLMKGQAEMQIGEKTSPVSPGSVIFLGSEVLHAIRNTGGEACEYFAFQWQ